MKNILFYSNNDPPILYDERGSIQLTFANSTSQKSTVPSQNYQHDDVTSFTQLMRLK